MSLRKCNMVWNHKFDPLTNDKVHKIQAWTNLNKQVIWFREWLFCEARRVQNKFTSETAFQRKKVTLPWFHSTWVSHRCWCLKFTCCPPFVMISTICHSICWLEHRTTFIETIFIKTVEFLSFCEIWFETTPVGETGTISWFGIQVVGTVKQRIFWIKISSSSIIKLGRKFEAT